LTNHFFFAQASRHCQRSPFLSKPETIIKNSFEFRKKMQSYIFAQLIYLTRMSSRHKNSRKKFRKNTSEKNFQFSRAPQIYSLSSLFFEPDLLARKSWVRDLLVFAVTADTLFSKRVRVARKLVAGNLTTRLTA
jgi:hypothetical protein